MMPQTQTLIAAFLARPGVARVLAALNGAGEETRVVGGAVRNLLFGVPVSDVDLATTALPEETIRRGRAAGFKTVPTGIEHGTVTLVGEGESFEVTTLRQDVETDGRRAKVVFGRDFVADALRRDFTINAMSLDAAGSIHDACGGLADLEARRIRFIGDAATRIREDYLRILRYFRFQAQYGADEPDRDGLAACIAGRNGLPGLSRERISAELMKLLMAPRAASTLSVMSGAGLLMPVIGGVPHLSRFAAMAEDSGETVSPAFRLAALAVGVREHAARLREHLRLSNDIFDRMERIALALERLGGRVRLPSIAMLRHEAVALGHDAVAGALTLLTAGADEPVRQAARQLVGELARTPAFEPSGKDVLSLGIPPGPAVGRVLDQARREWIDAGCPTGFDAQRGFIQATIAG